MNMIKSLDGQFSSCKLEEQYQAQQLAGIIQINDIFQRLLIILSISLSIISTVEANYISTAACLISALMSYAQIRYFKKKPSFKCLTGLNLHNISFALYRIYQAISTIQNPMNDPINEFARGASYFAIHLVLLVNTNFSQNIIVISIIFIIHYVELTLQKGSFNYFALVLIGVVGFYLSRLNIELKMKRKLFILQKEQYEWVNIIKAVINYPYLILSFNQEELKFHLKQANQQANQELKITDSLTMRQVLRQMSQISENTKLKNDFEKLIFDQVKNIEQNGVNGEEIHIVLNKVRYDAQIFLVQAEPITLLITFKDKSQARFDKSLQQTIINQQIASCNFANSQLTFCKKIENYVKNKNIQQSHIFLRRNIFQIHNMLAIFKTNHVVKISTFVMEKQICKLTALFPKIKFYFPREEKFCISDLKIFRSIIFNLFSVFISSSMITIDIRSQSSSYFIQIYTYPVHEKNFYLLKQTYEDKTPLSHLNKVHTKAQMNFSIFRKYLQIISPKQAIELGYNHIQSSLTLSFHLYKDLGILEG